RLRGVIDTRAAVLRGERDTRLPVRKSCRTALAFEMDRVRLRGHDVAQAEQSREAGTDRSHAHGHRGLELVLARTLARLPAPYAALERFWIVARGPRRLNRCWNGAGIGQLHLQSLSAMLTRRVGSVRIRIRPDGENSVVGRTRPRAPSSSRDCVLAG